MSNSLDSTNDVSVSSSSKNPMKYIKQLYDWTLKWADHKYNVYVLGFLSAIESIFFPIPVDPLLMAMGISRPKGALFFALVTTVTSVLGAFLGYWIGALFWEATQGFFIPMVFSQEIFDLVKTKFQENAALSIFLASFTPLPFKVSTIAGGVANISLSVFLISALVGRGARFFILGALVYFFGEPIKKFIDKYFNTLVIIFAALGTAGYLLLPKLLK